MTLLHAAIDLIAGAIAAWLEPQKIPIQPDERQEGVTMIGTMMKLGCAASGGRVTREFSLRHTSLKGRSPRTQSIFIGGMILLLTLILGSAGWIASRI